MKTTNKLVMGLTIFIIGGTMIMAGTIYQDKVYPNAENLFDTSNSFIYFQLSGVALLLIGTVLLYRFERDVGEKMITQSKEKANK